MDIKNIRDLGKIIALCRKKGVETIKIGQDSIELKLGATPIRAQGKQRKTTSQTIDEVLNEGELTDEQILLWSSPMQANEAMAEQ